MMGEELFNEIEAHLKVTGNNLEKIKYGYDECKHLQVWLDDQSHTVKCKNCGKLLDSFWYLQLLASEWDSRRYQDAEAIKAWKNIEQHEKNKKCAGKYYIKPVMEPAISVWNTYIALHDEEPKCIYRSGRSWYAEDFEGCTELYEYMLELLAVNRHKKEVKQNE